MPRELPGLYWDEERNRYFPLSARPASSLNQPGPSTSSLLNRSSGSTSSLGNARLNNSNHVEMVSSPPPRKRRRVELLPGGLTTGRLFGDTLKLSSNYAQIQRATDKIMSQSLAFLSEGKPFWHGDFVFSSLDVQVEPDGSFTASTGDKGGWLETYTTNKHGYPYCGSRELFLGSEVTAVCRSDAHRLAISFGPSSKIAVENVTDDVEIWNILSMGDHQCHDVHTAHLLGKSLVLGAAKRGILLSDIQAGWSFDVLPVGSDVLSVYQLEHIIYTGARNGSIQCFDKRLNSRQKGQELFNGKFRGENRSITHLSVINGTQMLVSTMKGDLELLDLRFARNTDPAVAFQGHSNAYTAKLGIATSPCLSYLFAAGQDRRIRAWSLLTGELISPTLHTQQQQPREDVAKLFQQTFNEPITAIRVTKGGGGGGASANGMTVWVASGKKIFRYWLGQRLGEGVSRY